MTFQMSRMMSYCIDNNLCTKMDVKQYEQFLHATASGDLTCTEAALILKFCSDTEKDRDEILVDIVHAAGVVSCMKN